MSTPASVRLPVSTTRVCLPRSPTSTAATTGSLQLGLAQDGFIAAVAAARARYGADRIGVFVGTSTSGILQTELAYRRRDPVTGALPDDFDYRDDAEYVLRRGFRAADVAA